jgi:hypothetical protein
MAELVLQHRRHVAGSAGREYDVRIVGSQMDGTWVGALEFHPISGGLVLRSDRETIQPTRDALIHWAAGLGDVFREGAFERAFDEASRERT